MDMIRHINVYNPKDDPCTQTMIVGAGAVGSHVALNLAKMSVPNLHFIDDDKIESHNISNQLYPPEMVGVGKVTALENLIWDQTRELSTGVYGKMDSSYGKIMFDRVIFCVDTMAARADIFKNCIRFNPGVKHLIDVRINPKTIILQSFNTQDSSHIRAYNDTLYKDEDVPANRGTCSNTQSIGSTAMIAAGLVGWLVINYVSKERNDNEVLFDIGDMSISKRQY